MTLAANEQEDDDGIDWAALANRYEEPVPKGAQFWGMGSFYKFAHGKVWVFVVNEWIRSSKRHCEIWNYTKVEESK